jgi:hypothetical protein
MPVPSARIQTVRTNPLLSAGTGIVPSTATLIPMRRRGSFDYLVHARQMEQCRPQLVGVATREWIRPIPTQPAIAAVPRLPTSGSEPPW